jgi:hypothetical protein
MPENINVPAVGKVDRRWVLAGGAAVAGIILFTYWRNARAAGEEPIGEGETYAGDQWTPDAYIGATAPGGETYDPGDIEDTTPTTNAEWSQRVVDLLENVGYDRNKAAATVGKYLSGQPLDATEKLIIQTAIALLGNPPAGALPIIPGPTPPTTPPPATTLQPPAGLTARPGIGKGRGRYVLTWSKVPDATGYQVRWVVRHLGGAVRTVGPSTFTYTTAVAPRTGYLAFEVRSLRGLTERSAWRRTVVRSR